MTNHKENSKKDTIINRIIMFSALFSTIIGSIMFAFNPIISMYGHLVLVFAALLWCYMAHVMKDYFFIKCIIAFSILNVLLFIFL